MCKLEIFKTVLLKYLIVKLNIFYGENFCVTPNGHFVLTKSNPKRSMEPKPCEYRLLNFSARFVLSTRFLQVKGVALFNFAIGEIIKLPYISFL